MGFATKFVPFLSAIFWRQSSRVRYLPGPNLFRTLPFWFFFIFSYFIFSARLYSEYLLFYFYLIFNVENNE
jgi:hypothetical protein